MSSPSQRRSTAGRIVVHTVFWSIAAAVFVALMGSVLANLYAAPPSPDSPGGAFEKRQRDWCLRTLIGLRDELEVEVTHELAYSPGRRPPMSRWSAWVDDWRAELEDAKVRCTAGHDPDMAGAYQQLGALFEAYQTGLQQIARSRSELLGALQHSVNKLSERR